VYVRRSVQPSAEHPLTADAPTYVAAGDRTQDSRGARFRTLPLGASGSWFHLTGVDVLAPRRARTLVALGDSITEGWGSIEALGGSHNRRYPDYLARRLLRAGEPMSVVNEGIVGDQPSDALTRLDRDVLGVPGVSHVLLLEGINDLQTAPVASAEPIIERLRELVGRLHRARLRVLVGTLTPDGALSPRAEMARVAVNDWIRTSGVPDAVVDFDAALRDPGAPSRMRPAYSSDPLHPGARGYRRMAEAVPLGLLRAGGCR
jgi:lysophospholipase L1-like esterase